MKDEEDKKNEEKKKLDLLSNFPGESLQNSEISTEQKDERLFLSGLLFEKTEDLTKEDLARKKKRQKEIREKQIIDFDGRAQTTIGEIIALIAASRQPYLPKFPNENPFFKEIFRLNHWSHLDPDKYSKPPVVAEWINEIIYGRFPKDILPALQALNPIIPGGFRKDKLFQHLNEEGQKLVEQYRDEATNLMESCVDWYEFRKKLFEKYKVPYQIKAF